MEVGIRWIFQNYLGRGRDEDVVRTEMRLARLAEELGYDKVWAVEHHFTDYAGVAEEKGLETAARTYCSVNS